MVRRVPRRATLAIARIQERISILKDDLWSQMAAATIVQRAALLDRWKDTTARALAEVGLRDDSQRLYGAMHEADTLQNAIRCHVSY
jgi:hypothetical protein